MKMCNTHLARCWKASKLKEVHLYNRHWRARFPAGTIPPHGTGTGAATQRGLTHLPGTRAASPRQNAFAGSVRVATLAQLAPTTRPLCLQFCLVEGKQNASPLCHGGAEPERCTRTERREREWPLQAERQRAATGGGRFKEPTGQYQSAWRCSSLPAACCQEFITIIYI